MSARATPPPRAASSMSLRTTWPRMLQSRPCVPSSAGAGTPRFSPTTTTARRSAWRTQPRELSRLPDRSRTPRMVTVTELKELPGGGDPEVPHETPRPTPAALPRRLPATTDSSREAMLTRQQRLRDDGYEIEQIAGRGPEIEPERLPGSIGGVRG